MCIVAAATTTTQKASNDNNNDDDTRVSNTTTSASGSKSFLQTVWDDYNDDEGEFSLLFTTVTNTMEKTIDNNNHVKINYDKVWARVVKQKKAVSSIFGWF